VNVAVPPALAVWFVGWAVIDGAVAAVVFFELSPPDPPQPLNMKMHTNPNGSLFFILQRR
jgi:hypothetical protein